MSYNGAAGAPRISVIGDSVMAAIRWYGTWAPLRVYNYTVDVESCRRTIGSSCGGREGYRPDNTVQAMRRLRGQLGSVVVIGTGYDDSGSAFSSGVDAVMAEAAAQGIAVVVWATMRTADVNYVGPTYRSNRSTFLDNNRILLAKQTQYRGRLRVADWATYSASRSDWVEWDGIHLTPSGATAMAQFIASQSASALRSARLPASPRLSATSLGANQVRLNWTTPAWPGASPILDYRYQYSTNGGATWTTGVAGPPSARTTVVSGLSNNTTYTFRIAARNSIGWSYTSNRVTVITRLSPPSTPVLNVVTALGANQVRLNWTGSPFTGGSPILDYRYQYSTNGGATWTTGAAPPNVRTIVVNGLSNNTTYTFRIAARTRVGWSYTSNRITVTTRLSPPSRPTLRSVTALGANQVQLSFAGSAFSGGSPILDYRYQYSSDGGVTWTTGVVPVSVRTIVVSGLRNNTTYVFRIAARTRVGWSYTSNRISVTTRVSGPSRPTLSASAVGADRVQLDWSGSTYDGGSPILDYRYQYSTDGGTTWTTGIAGPPTARSTVVEGLVNNTTYIFRVAARNGVAWSYTSNRVTVTTPSASARQASIPTAAPQTSTSTTVLATATSTTVVAPTTTTAVPTTTAPTAPTGPVSGIVWLDLDSDGRRDDSESALAGTVVRFVDADGLVTAETVTDTYGAYEFPAAHDGSVEFALPDGYDPTLTDSVSDDTVDSDPAAVDVVTIDDERTVRVSLGTLRDPLHLDLGLVTAGTTAMTTTTTDTPQVSEPTTTTTRPAGTAPAPTMATAEPAVTEPATTTPTTEPAITTHPATTTTSTAAASSPSTVPAATTIPAP